MSKRLVNLGEAFDIIDWNILSSASNNLLGFQVVPVYFSSSLGTGEGVVMQKIESSP